MAYGLFYSYGNFFAPLEHEFGWGRGETAVAFSIYLIVYGLAAIPMGWLFDRYGPRLPLFLGGFLIGLGMALSGLTTDLWHLYLSFGFVAALGHGATYVVPTSTIAKWFVKGRGLAVGIAVSGIGAGTMVIPPLVERLIAFYGWRAAFLILGLVFFAVDIIAGMLMRQSPARPVLYTEEVGSGLLPGARDYTSREALATWSFWAFYFSISFAFSAETIAVVHIVPFARGIGIPSLAAAAALSFLGIGSAVGRIGMGALSDRFGRLRVLALNYLLQTITLLVLLKTASLLMLYILMFFLGLSYGGWAVVFAPIVGELFGFKHMGKILALAMTSGSVSGLLGPALGGYMFDFTGSYTLTFIFAALISFLAAVLSFLLLLKRGPQFG